MSRDDWELTTTADAIERMVTALHDSVTGSEHLHLEIIGATVEGARRWAREVLTAYRNRYGTIGTERWRTGSDYKGIYVSRGIILVWTGSATPSGGPIDAYNLLWAADTGSWRANGVWHTTKEIGIMTDTKDGIVIETK